jgi:cyclopropane-fatty-acyl-phospholipid synthase
MKFSKVFIKGLLLKAGITIGGNKPYDIHVHNEAFYDLVMTSGSLGLGESYIEKYWDCAQIDEFINRIIRADLSSEVGKDFKSLARIILAKVKNYQKASQSASDISEHYDIGDGWYESFLDNRMVYTCGYWKNATNLDEAQEAKLNLSCRKEKIEDGMHILDIGSGWGSYAKYVLENFKNVTVTGISNCKTHVQYATNTCKAYKNRVEFQLHDWGKIAGKYDAIASFGMFEHVGPKNYRRFMKKVYNSLSSDESLFLLHCISSNTATTSTDPYIQKRIFPGTVIPSVAGISKATDGLLKLEDWHLFGQDYDTTLMAWHNNFVKNFPELFKIGKFNERNFRKQVYYFCMCAGSFRANKNDLSQIVFSKNAAHYNIER